MRDVVKRLSRAIEQHLPVAYCRLVETRGSTPQKAGAVMLVFPHGEQAGTLGGGCVEAEVKRRALAVLAEQRPSIEKFQLDHDYGWDDGLICGGRMQVLIQPASNREAEDYYRQLAGLVDQDRGWTEAVVFDAEASQLSAPMSFLFDDQGQLAASLGFAGSEIPASVASGVNGSTPRTGPHTKSGVAFLPVARRCRLVIIGGGHVGKAVSDLASDLDFDVWIVDDRSEFVSRERFPQAERLISGEMEQVLRELETTPDTYCLIVTRGHQHDQRALFHLAERNARYVGMIGSKRKIKLIFENLVAEGISPEALRRVYAPLGIDIGSQTVAEIAISICAELVAHRNREGQVPGRPAPASFAFCSAGT